MPYPLIFNSSGKTTVGPLVSTDGITPYAGGNTASLVAADEAELLKSGAVVTAGLTTANNTFSAIADADGYYAMSYVSADTDTYGEMDLVIQDDSLFLPYKKPFVVMNVDAYNAQFGATGPVTPDQIAGVRSDVGLQATAVELSGLKSDVAIVDSNVDTLIAQAADTRSDIALVPGLTWDEVLTGGTHNIVNSAGRRLRQQQEAGGYDNGLVWLDSINGTIGTTNFENGTTVAPVTSAGDADTILSSLALHGVHCSAGSLVTFTASQENQEWTGEGWTLELGGQSIAGTSIIDAVISGISSGQPIVIRSCFLNACTFAGGDFIDCGIGDTITLSSTSIYHFFNCHHAEAGAPSTIDFGAAVGGTEVHIHGWHGNLLIKNMGAGDILHFTCSDGALTLDSSNDAGTKNLSGNFGLTDNSTGQTTNDLGLIYDRIGAPVGDSISADLVVIDGNVDTLIVQAADTRSDIAALSAAGDPWATELPGAYTAATAGNIVGNAIAGDTAGTRSDLNNVTDGLGAIKTAVDLAATAVEMAGLKSDVAIVDGNIDTLVIQAADTRSDIAALDFATPAEMAATQSQIAVMDANVDIMVAGIINGVAETGTLTTEISSTDLTGYTADQLIGRIITFLAGPADGESSDILDYNATNGVITYTAMTLAAENGNAFKIT